MPFHSRLIDHDGLGPTSRWNRKEYKNKSKNKNNKQVTRKQEI